MSRSIALDLNLGTAHLMDIIEGPAGYSAESILIRYQAPYCTEDDDQDDVEGDNPPLYAATATATAAAVVQQQQPQPHQDDDTMTVKSSSTAGSASTTAMLAQQQQQQQQERTLRRRRQSQRRRRDLLDDRIWFILQSLERFARRCRHLSLRFVGCRFPAPALAWWLQRAPQLEGLHLRVTLAGSLGGLAKALQRHPRLAQVSLDHCRPSFPEEQDDDDEDDRSRNDRSSNSRRRRRRKRSSKAHSNNKDEDDEAQDDYDYRRLDDDKSSSTRRNQQARKKAPPPPLASLEPLLDALAESLTLRSFTLSHTLVAFTAAHRLPTTEDGVVVPTTTTPQPPSAWNAGASLSHFLRRSSKSSSLTKLCLEHMTEIRDEDFATMMTALEESPNHNNHQSSRLRTLSIRQCAMGPLAGQALGKMLATNTSLQTLDVNIHWWDGRTYEETPEGQYVAQCWVTDVTALIQGLSTNTGLQCLGLYCDNLAYSHAAAVVSMLEASVEASVRQLCAQALDALPQVFQTPTGGPARHERKQQENRSLEDIIVGHRSFGLSPEIDFYLNWNRAGRDYFSEHHEGATKTDWIDAILNHRGELSVVYALVSINPAMFQ